MWHKSFQKAEWEWETDFVIPAPLWVLHHAFWLCQCPFSLPKLYPQGSPGVPPSFHNCLHRWYPDMISVLPKHGRTPPAFCRGLPKVQMLEPCSQQQGMPGWEKLWHWESWATRHQAHPWGMEALAWGCSSPFHGTDLIIKTDKPQRTETSQSSPGPMGAFLYSIWLPNLLLSRFQEHKSRCIVRNLLSRWLLWRSWNYPPTKCYYKSNPV